MTIRKTILSYYEKTTKNDDDRLRSWEHCYQYFQGLTPKEIKRDRHHAALQLGFYLASWGMYRGSSFLTRYDYTAHLPVIDLLVEPRFKTLWQQEFGTNDDDTVALRQMLCELIGELQRSYGSLAKRAKKKTATDTLITKVLLGTISCIPACDKYFKAGLRKAGFTCPSLKTDRGVERFIGQLLEFSGTRREKLLDVQKATKCRPSGAPYPIMKLVDMYFWQKGRKKSNR